MTDKPMIYLEDAFNAVVDFSGQATTKSAYAAFWKAGNKLKELPTVDAREVINAKWELEGNDDELGCSYFCSNCKDCYDEDWFYVTGKYRPFNYCPTCGAKMSLED